MLSLHRLKEGSMPSNQPRKHIGVKRECSVGIMAQNHAGSVNHEQCTRADTEPLVANPPALPLAGESALILLSNESFPLQGYT